MKIFVFGNPDLKEDSLPVRILPRLKKIFPDIAFTHLDPNEELEKTEELIIIDTVVGFKKVEVISDLSLIKKGPKITLHDFDLGSLLIFLKKLGKISRVKIIGVPAQMDEDEAFSQVKLAIAKLQTS